MNQIAFSEILLNFKKQPNFTRENAMDIFWEELTYGLPDRNQLVHLIIRLTGAILLGAVIGIQRESKNKPAGLRTHILVTLGTTVFIVACNSFGMSSDGLSRVIQGIVTGIGFIGAGSILKSNEGRSVRGLTTSASVWMAAAIGVAVGLGALGVAILTTFATLIVLMLAGKIEFQIDEAKDASNEKEDE